MEDKTAGEIETFHFWLVCKRKTSGQFEIENYSMTGGIEIVWWKKLLMKICEFGIIC